MCRARVAIWADWLGDDIYFADNQGEMLHRIPARGGDEPSDLFNVTKSCPYGGVVSCVLPGGQAAILSLRSPHSSSSNHAEIRVISLAGDETKTLPINGFNVRYLASGHLVYGRSGGVWAIPFDLKRLELTDEGKKVCVLENVAMESIFGNVHVAFADNGTVAFVSGYDLATGRLAWVDRETNQGFVDNIPEDIYGVFDVSLDQQYAIEVAGIKNDVKIWDVNGMHVDDLRDGESSLGNPVWDPNGRRLAMVARTPGSETVEVVIHEVDKGVIQRIPLPESRIYPVCWPNAENIGVIMFRANVQIGILNLMASKNPLQPILPKADSDSNRSFPAFSSDLGWVVYQSSEGGKGQIIIEQVTGEKRRQVSTNGGIAPVWCQETGELFYRQGNQILVRDVTLEPKLDLGRPPEVAFEAPDFVDTKGLSFRVSSDGQRLFYIRRTQHPETDRIRIIHNWFSELDRLVPIED